MFLTIISYTCINSLSRNNSERQYTFVFLNINSKDMDYSDDNIEYVNSTVSTWHNTKYLLQGMCCQPVFIWKRCFMK